MTLFHHIFVSKAGKTFILEALNQGNLEETCKLIANSYAISNPLCVASGIDESTFEKLAQIICHLSLIDNLGIVCIDPDNSKIVGACIFCDNLRTVNNADLFKDLSSPLKDLLDMLNKFSTKIVAKQSLDSINGFFFAVSPALMDQRICKEMLKFAILMHPLICKTPVVFTYSTNSIVLKLLKEMDWKEVEVQDPKLYVNSKGENIYKDIDEAVQKLKLPSYEGVVLIKRDRSEILEELMKSHFA